MLLMWHEILQITNKSLKQSKLEYRSKEKIVFKKKIVFSVNLFSIFTNCSITNVIHQQHRVFFEVKVFYFDVFRFHSFLRLDSDQQNPTLV